MDTDARIRIAAAALLLAACAVVLFANRLNAISVDGSKLYGNIAVAQMTLADQYAYIQCPSIGHCTQSVNTATIAVVTNMGSGASTSGFTTTHSNIVVGTAGAGHLEVCLAHAATASGAALFHFHVYTNGVLTSIGSSDDTSQVNSQISASSFGILEDVSSGTSIDVRVSHDNGAARTIISDHFTFSVRRHLQ